MTISVIDEMAGTYSTSNPGDPQISITLDWNPTSGSSMHVFMIANSAANGAHYALNDSSGNSYTKRGDFTTTAGYRVSHWTAENIVGGTTPTLKANIQYDTTNPRGMIIREIGGAAAASYDIDAEQEQATPGVGANGVTTGTATVANQPALVSGITLSLGWNATITEGTDFTPGMTGSSWISGGSYRTEHQRITATGSKAATWTTDHDNEFASVMAVFDEAAAGSKKMLTLGVG